MHSLLNVTHTKVNKIRRHKMEKNPSIQCTVDDCKYHSGNVNYCTLNNIQVGKNETKATATENTDCESFEVNQRSY